MQAQRSHQKDLDLIVIGGGITGCGVAYEAAARGANVLLLERADFAAGTSSRSTKLIHGGLRYLKQFDFRLVREGVSERQQLLETAPHLVHPVQFVYPVYKGDPDNYWVLRMGLMLYDWFAGRRNLLPHQVFPGNTLLRAEPLLRSDGLRGGALYADCLTDDARLTIEVAKAAAQQGAVLLNYMTVRRFLFDDQGRVNGVQATDELNGDQAVQCYAPVVLNATGPWVDQIRQLDDPDSLPLLRPTKGVHIAVPHQRLPIGRPVVMHAADGRLMFAVPRDRFTYLGTTDTDYQGDPAQVTANRTDVAYILAATNRTFPQAGLLESDVVSTWAGLRALAAPPTETGPSQVSRDYKLFTSRSGLISVAGGKLTAFAAMARSIVRHVLPDLKGMAVPPALAGSVVPAATVNALATEFQVNAAGVTALADRHGAQVGKVLAYLTHGTGSEHERLFAAEAAYAVDHEFAVQVTDVLIRRTGQLLFSEDHGQSVAKAVASAMGGRLGWDEQTQLAQVHSYVAEIAAMQSWRHETDTKAASVPV